MPFLSRFRQLNQLIATFSSGLHPAKQSTDVTENLARVSRISEPRGATAVELEAEVKRRSIVEKIVHKKND